MKYSKKIVCEVQQGDSFCKFRKKMVCVVQQGDDL